MLLENHVSRELPVLQQNYRNFQYFQSAQNQPKSQVLFHKNSSLHDFYQMTLSAARLRTSPPCAVEVNSAGLESIFRFPQLTFLYPGKGTSAFVKRLLDINRLKLSNSQRAWRKIQSISTLVSLKFRFSEDTKILYMYIQGSSSNLILLLFHLEELQKIKSMVSRVVWNLIWFQYKNTYFHHT